MIRPSIAPIKPKLLKQLQFEKSFPSLNTDIIVVKAKTEIEERQKTQPQKKSEPIPNILVQLQKRQKLGLGRVQQFDNQNQFAQFKQYTRQLIYPLVNENKNEIEHLKSEITELRTFFENKLKKYKFDIQENLRRIISNVVSSLHEGKQPSQKVLMLQNRLNTIGDKLNTTENHHLQITQKLNKQIGQLTSYMTVLATRIESMEGYFNLNLPQLKLGGGLSEIKQYVGSKIVSESLQPQQIASEYQESTMRTVPLSQIKIPSLIRKLDNVEEACSEMIYMGQDGDVTDIRGMPIIDKNGNLVILNLQQIRTMLDRQISMNTS